MTMNPLITILIRSFCFSCFQFLEYLRCIREGHDSLGTTRRSDCRFGLWIFGISVDFRNVTIAGNSGDCTSTLLDIGNQWRLILDGFGEIAGEETPFLGALFHTHIPAHLLQNKHFKSFSIQTILIINFLQLFQIIDDWRKDCRINEWIDLPYPWDHRNQSFEWCRQPQNSTHPHPPSRNWRWLSPDKELRQEDLRSLGSQW